MSEKLNERQEAFCQFYAASEHQGNGSASARAAGYSVASANSMARDLLKLDKITHRILEIKACAGDVVMEKFNLDRESIIQEILDGLAHAKAEARYKLGSSGKPIRDKDGNMLLTRSETAILGYITLLAKMGGFLTDSLNVKVESEKIMADKLAEARKRVYSDDGPRLATVNGD